MIVNAILGALLFYALRFFWLRRRSIRPLGWQRDRLSRHRLAALVKPPHARPVCGAEGGPGTGLDIRAHVPILFR
jgi:hypothetical protein